MGFLISSRSLSAIRAAACCALVTVASYAMAGGRPPVELGTQTGINDGQSGIVLDTRSGIHDGQSGLVLQNAPFSQAPMVPAKRLPTIDPVDAGAEQTPVIVAPYIALPGASGVAPAGAAGYRMIPGARQ
ncbi:hypothetical protein AB1286_18570 [Trinickia sp. NRRL B-1857]|uniref:hypothetical protein n=1 Tax=Trinickia sp. NRRL B-1857 TaxID=3162879 RepID=UPI003D2D2AC6